MTASHHRALSLLSVVAVTAAGSWLVGQVGSPGPVPPAAHGLERGPESKGPPIAHAVWNRHRDMRALMSASQVVVKATVVGTAPAPPVTAADAHSAPGAPEIRRQRVTFKTDEVVFGDDPGATFTVMHALPPKGTILPEDPPYEEGDQNLLFLQPAVGPGPDEPVIEGMWQRVGIDGRLPVAKDGSFKGLLENGPAPEINEKRGDLRRAAAEAKR